LLLNGKKFDIRCYMLLATTKPEIMAYYAGPGYCRLTIADYSTDPSNKAAHLTNQAVHGARFEMPMHHGFCRQP
jgi:hypothetical protein